MIQKQIDARSRMQLLVSLTWLLSISLRYIHLKELKHICCELWHHILYAWLQNRERLCPTLLCALWRAVLSKDQGQRDAGNQTVITDPTCSLVWCEGMLVITDMLYITWIHTTTYCMGMKCDALLIWVQVLVLVWVEHTTNWHRFINILI